MEAELTEFERLMRDFVESVQLWISTMAERKTDGIEEECWREFIEFWQQQN